MRFSSDSQRRAMFANLNCFARRPSDKMVREVFESANEPVTDFRQLVPDQGNNRVETYIDETANLGSARIRRTDVVTMIPSFPEYGNKLFTSDSSGSLDEAKRDANVVAEAISGGNGVGWVQPIWVNQELIGYTVRLRNIITGEDILDKDTSVYEDFIDDVQ